jgi:hypothetical protein
MQKLPLDTYRGKLNIIIRNPYSYTRTDVYLLMQFPYAHLYVKAKMVFIPNNISYRKFIFATCEFFPRPAVVKIPPTPPCHI